MPTDTAEFMYYIKLNDEIGQLFHMVNAPKGVCQYRFLHPNGDMIAGNEPAIVTKEARKRYIKNHPTFQPAPAKGAQR